MYVCTSFPVAKQGLLFLLPVHVCMSVVLCAHVSWAFLRKGEEERGD